MQCRFCHSKELETFCDLGVSPLSNSYLTDEQMREKEPFFPLHARVCMHCLLVQLPQLHAPSTIFEEYAYFSSYSSSWLEHARLYTQQMIECFELNSHSFVLEIASNDGYLLQYFKQKGIPVLGIEPAQNVAQAARQKGIDTLSCFFSSQLATTLPQADLIVANNVLAHVPDLNDFVGGLRSVLKASGVLTLEFPHLLKLIEFSQFDTIYHEHFSYFSLLTLQKVFRAHALEIFDVEELPTHGGSLRLYVQHPKNRPIKRRVMDLEKKERAHGLDRMEIYKKFPHKVQRIKEDLVQFLHSNPDVVAYGAPAKGNTLLNHCGVGPQHLRFTVDLNPYKQNKYLPGTHIPIYSPQKILEDKPLYVLILPWNLKEEIMNQMSVIRTWGAKFVIPIPQLEIV